MKENKQKNYYSNKRVYSKKKFPKKRNYSYRVKINPGKDASLEKVFESIGVPEKTPFKPDNFQIEALKAIEKYDCLVTVPTGSGKTWIAEEAISKVFLKGGKSWYATPLKALSNSKYNEFSERFGSVNVGILTGDRKENIEASILVGTTEILRNQLYDSMHKGEDLDSDFVVLDEAHFLGNEDRGVVWEEVMIYLPRRIPLLLLSATIGNARQIADWLQYIRTKECVVIQETERPVELHQLFLHPSGTLFPLTSYNKIKEKNILNKKVSKFLKNPFYMCNPRALPPFSQIMDILRKYNLLPAIVFLKSRIDCNRAVELCLENKKENIDRKTKRESRIDSIIRKHPLLLNHKQLRHLKKYAVGAHHSGQLPFWKIIIESLMTDGLLDAVFATTTVAAGVNFPARTVVFLNSDRFNGHEFLPLDATEYHQMTGRAGRRGADKIGFALTIPGKFMDVRLFAKLNDSPPSDVLSQIKINFSMTLNLLLSHNPEQIKELLEKSFATYLIVKEKKLSYKRKKEAKTRLFREFTRNLNFLKKENFVNENDMLTEDGTWTSQLRVDQPLLIAEGFRQNIFPQNNPPLLASLIASFVNERETDDIKAEDMAAPFLVESFYTMVEALRPMTKRMKMSGFFPGNLYFQPCLTIFDWCNGESWENVMEKANMAEGDLAMLILRTVDNLRHISSLYQEFPSIADSARIAIEKLLREPVIMDI